MLFVYSQYWKWKVISTKHGCFLIWDDQIFIFFVWSFQEQWIGRREKYVIYHYYSSVDSLKDRKERDLERESGRDWLDFRLCLPPVFFVKFEVLETRSTRGRRNKCFFFFLWNPFPFFLLWIYLLFTACPSDKKLFLFWLLD